VRPVRLHDTRTGEPVALDPRDGRRVGIYACGPTVYSRVHVGNARPYVVFMLLARFLRHEGYEPVLAANVTDINDKIYDAARAAGRPSAELAREMTAHYMADTDRLGLGRPDHEPLATEMVAEITALIAALLARDHAYEADGDVYFRVRSLPEYGALSHRDVDQMDQGEGVEGAERKEDPLDFALWKAQKPFEDTAWDAPWGRGRPGWHVECSAMAEALLGLEFEVHGGGIDLVFPHHENEAAQTLAARGRPLARIWMHNGMVELGGSDGDAEKMSKSLGNIRGLAEVLDEVGRDALVMYFCEGHYRQPLAFSRERFEDASRRLERIRDAGRRLVPGASPPALAPHRDAFFAALADDFNTPRALAALSEWIREANKGTGVGDADLREMLGVLGLENVLEAGEGPPAEVVELAEQRAGARARRDFAEADRLRDELQAHGWVVRDGPGGPELVPAAP
jgi:cysteinyl-tRNA synthetase